MNPLKADKPDIKEVVKNMDQMCFTRDDLMDNLPEFMFDKIDISTKVKTALTREYNKAHPVRKTAKTIKKLSLNDMESDDDELEDDIDQELEVDEEQIIEF
jgi:hypothetical protein